MRTQLAFYVALPFLFVALLAGIEAFRAYLQHREALRGWIAQDRRRRARE